MTAVIAPIPAPTTPAVRHVVLHSPRRGQPWRELFSSRDPEAAWSFFISFKGSGDFRVMSLPADLFTSAD